MSRASEARGLVYVEDYYKRQLSETAGPVPVFHPALKPSTYTIKLRNKKGRGETRGPEAKL